MSDPRPALEATAAAAIPITLAATNIALQSLTRSPFALGPEIRKDLYDRAMFMGVVGGTWWLVLFGYYSIRDLFENQAEGLKLLRF